MIIFCIVSFIAGVILANCLFYCKYKISGRFVVNMSDSEKDICTLELNSDLDEIMRNKYLILKISLK